MMFVDLLSSAIIATYQHNFRIDRPVCYFMIAWQIQYSGIQDWAKTVFSKEIENLPNTDDFIWESFVYLNRQYYRTAKEKDEDDGAARCEYYLEAHQKGEKQMLGDDGEFLLAPEFLNPSIIDRVSAGWIKNSLPSKCSC